MTCHWQVLPKAVRDSVEQQLRDAGDNTLDTGVTQLLQESDSTGMSVTVRPFEWECGCGIWSRSGLPCFEGLRAIRDLRKMFPDCAQFQLGTEEFCRAFTHPR
jgi:hypothetical protein